MVPELLDGARPCRYVTIVPSPVGDLLLAGDGEVLGELSFAMDDGSHRLPAGAVRDRAPFVRILRELEAYFAGEGTGFTMPLAPGGTPFQRGVWRHLLGIPYGATVSYADVARGIGSKRATRAVGLANARNPIAIIVPCHRVVGRDGSLTGYGGGLSRKKWLLEHEAKRQTAGTAGMREGELPKAR